MKKVLVLLIAGALLAAPAFSGIRNSKHDLSSSSTANITSNNNNELCVFCHTPHGATPYNLAPLWNRSIATGGFDAADLYNSATLTPNVSNPFTVLSAVNASDAPLCLSCHDGLALDRNALANEPNSLGIGGLTAFDVGSNSVTGEMIILDGGNGLTNDHPIGMDYSAAIIPDGELNAITGAYPNEHVVAGIDKLPLYTTTGVMWCSTCHDVHNSTKGTPFLNTSNAGSAMCLACHNK